VVTWLYVSSRLTSSTLLNDDDDNNDDLKEIGHEGADCIELA
jgi:hypothetical protein